MAVENKIKWVLAETKYKKGRTICVQVLTTDHPLQQIGDKFTKSHSISSLDKSRTRLSLQSSTETCFVDPLSIVLDGLDPLTSLAANVDRDSVVNGSEMISSQKTGKPTESSKSPASDLVLSWESVCTELRKFTTTYPLTLASSFLSFAETAATRNLPDYRRVVKVQNNIPDRSKGTGQTNLERVKARLEKLDSLDEGGSVSGGTLKEMGGLTQEQFTQHLFSLKEEMKEAWNDDQRVKALKIAIQCVKALSLSPPEMFYPCKFAVISELLDTLGTLVHTRLLQLLEASHSSVFFSPKLEAEETARNWFYKITSIRDLLPRIYLETALFESYSISPSQEDDVLGRLILMCRGIGDPLVGAYARAYIVHVGLRCKPKETKYIVNAVEDLVTSCKWGWNGSGLEFDDLMTESIGRPQVVAERVFYPAFKWLMQCVPKTQENLQKLLKQIENSKSTAHYVIIKSVLETFPATDLCLNYKVILQGLDLCFSHGEKPHETLITLADVATKCPPSEEDKFDVLNGAWQLVVRINPSYNHYYLKTATAWLKFTANNFPIRDVDKILGDVLRRLSKSTSANHTFYIPLLSLLTCALSSAPFTEELYTLSSFRSLLSIFQRESVGSVGSNNVGELRKLIEAVIQYHREEFSDLSVVQLLLSLFATLHDGINALTTQDEKRQITYLVNTFIRKVNYGKDFELQLQFYVDARSVFSSLDPVLASLIQHVLRLQMLTYHVVGGHHTGKTAAFERACSAYCFITIPSLSCPMSRIKLYMLTGAIAMINNCMGQGDACVKSAVKTILEIPQAFNDSSVPMDEILRTISYVSSFLIAFPDPPDAVRPLYLFRGLEKSLKSLEGILTPSVYCSLNLAVLKGVCSCAMSSLPYHFIKVDGNDILYGGGPDMKAEAEDICTELLSNVLASLKELIGLSDSLQVDILCELLEIILQNGDLSDEKLNNLAVSLLTLINNISPNTKLKKNLKLMFEKKKNQQ